jgi:H3 lysine-79-specific histone-lysine N-methyltransferase
MRHVYDLTAPDPAALKAGADPGSGREYGELEPETISTLIAEAGINAQSTFVDLGSGIGNVVLQVALEAGCACCGWEIMPARAAIAQTMLRHFKMLVGFFGLRAGEIRLAHGSFLSAPAVWLRCSHIFSNNLVFSSQLLENMKSVLHKCPEGTQIITSKSLSSVGRNGRVVHFNERTAHDIGAILLTRRLVGTWHTVSWTDSPIDFFISTVNREPLRRYLQMAADSRLAEILDNMTLWELPQAEESPEQKLRRVPFDAVIANSELGKRLAKDSIFPSPQAATDVVRSLCEAVCAPKPQSRRNGCGRIVFRCPRRVRNELYDALFSRCMDGNEEEGYCPFLVVLTYAHSREQWRKARVMQDLVVRRSVLVHWC